MSDGLGSIISAFTQWLTGASSDQPPQQVYRVDREGVCYPPERKIVLKAKPAREDN